MKITALVENQSSCELSATHGLSLLIETEKHTILFDVGPDGTVFENCDTRGIDLKKVDTVVISHGHADHGGALDRFLAINTTAKIYVQRKAFEGHYAKDPSSKRNIGLDAQLQTHPQIILLDGDYAIDDALLLFTEQGGNTYYSTANDSLYAEDMKDDFSHEQSLMLCGDVNTVVMGCGHAGVVDILEKAKAYAPKVCIGGYHLYNPATKETVSQELLEGIAQELAQHDIRYHTCHCTGMEAYAYLVERVPTMKYLSCGETIEI